MLRDKMMSFQRKKQFALWIKHQARADAVILDPCSRLHFIDMMSYNNIQLS